jgi:hypothetical protein
VRLSRPPSDSDKSDDPDGHKHPILNMDAKDIEPLSEQMHRPPKARQSIPYSATLPLPAHSVHRAE